tara:strand:- start:3773 stop:3991 length:219 start_codon:yes stop_codon:yes gene_type:complete
MESNQDKMENLEILLNELYGDLKETVTHIIERTIQHREYYQMNLKDELEESFNKIPGDEYDRLREEHLNEKD